MNLNENGWSGSEDPRIMGESAQLESGEMWDGRGGEAG